MWVHTGGHEGGKERKEPLSLFREKGSFSIKGSLAPMMEGLLSERREGEREGKKGPQSFGIQNDINRKFWRVV